MKKSIEEQGKLTEELSAAIDARRRRWRRWRTCTAPISRSAAPGPPRRRKRGWSLWQRCCSPRSGTAPAGGGGTAASSTRRRGWRRVAGRPAGRQRHHCRADLRRRRRPQEPAGAAGTPGNRCALWPPRRRTASTACTMTLNQSLSSLQGHQILAINRGEREEKLKVTVDCWIGNWRCLGCPAGSGEARRCRYGICESRRRGRL